MQTLFFKTGLLAGTVTATLLCSIACRAMPHQDALVQPVLIHAGEDVGGRGGKKVAAQAVITVAPFKDNSGTAVKSADGKLLADQVTLGFRRLLAEQAKGHYIVSANGKGPKDLPLFTVEGEIATVGIGSADTQPLVLVMRLYQEGSKGRKMVAQFTGKSPTLRGLTGNLQQQGGISGLGLLGEIGEQLGKAVSLHQNNTNDFDKMVKTATAVRRITVDVLGENGKPVVRQQVNPGDKFQLRVNSADKGAVYIVQLDKNGNPMTPYSQDDPMDVAPNAPVLLPPNNSFIAPKGAGGSTLEYVVFIRKGGAAPGTETGTETGAGTQTGTETGVEKPAQNNNATFHGYGMGAVVQDDNPFLRTSFHAEEDNPEQIELLSVVAPGQEPNEGIVALIAQYQNDPAGKWIGVRIKVPVITTDGNGTGSPAPTAKPRNGTGNSMTR